MCHKLTMSMEDYIAEMGLGYGSEWQSADMAAMVAEYRNQLQSKGISGEILEIAVADFVKFVEDQNEAPSK
jgi:hypothetical protein